MYESGELNERGRDQKGRRGRKLGFEWEKDSTGTGSRAVTAVTTAIQYAGIGLSLPHATARRAGQFDRRCLWPRILKDLLKVYYDR